MLTGLNSVNNRKVTSFSGPHRLPDRTAQFRRHRFRRNLRSDPRRLVPYDLDPSFYFSRAAEAAPVLSRVCAIRPADTDDEPSLMCAAYRSLLLKLMAAPGRG